MPYLTPLTETS